MKPSEHFNLSADQVGALLVSFLGVGMVCAPGVSWLLGDGVSASGMVVRGGVAVVSRPYTSDS